MFLLTGRPIGKVAQTSSATKLTCRRDFVCTRAVSSIWKRSARGGARNENSHIMAPMRIQLAHQLNWPSRPLHAIRRSIQAATTWKRCSRLISANSSSADERAIPASIVSVLRSANCRPPTATCVSTTRQETLLPMMSSRSEP